MSDETYDDMMETINSDPAIREAEREYAENGLLFDAGKIFDYLRRKYFG